MLFINKFQVVHYQYTGKKTEKQAAFWSYLAVKVLGKHRLGSLNNNYPPFYLGGQFSKSLLAH